MLVGINKKEASLPPEYQSLTELQQLLYTICSSQFDEIKERIKLAKELLPVRKRTINKSEVCRLAEEQLDRGKINHSHMSKQNCPFLYESIEIWNAKLIAEFERSNAKINKSSRGRSAESLEILVQSYEQRDTDIGRDFLDYLKDSCLFESESELQNKIDILTKSNSRLAKENVHIKKSRDEMIEQLSGRADLELENKRLRKQVIKLNNLLAEHGIDHTNDV